MKKIADYTVLSPIAETSKSQVFKAQHDTTSENVIIKFLKKQYPSPTEIARFKQEYNIIKTIDNPGVVRTHHIIDSIDGVAIVLEDFDGVSLKQILEEKKRLGIRSFLQIAIKLAGILGEIHQAGITHRDIKPANILINPSMGVVKLTDFGISTILTRENEEIYNPNIIEGTLVYMSPEQTGRMNRNIDYRTDLYSLGVTLYEMISGTVPFRSSDPMEIIHAHIAKKPASLAESKGKVPAAIDNIIMKLLAKTAEERYQNAYGLMWDLKQCMSQLKATGTIRSFTPGEKDISNKFNIPQKLVGRKDELEAMLSAFERVCGNSSEMTLVAGKPGIGKSALINEIHKPIVAKKGYFTWGKYDQFRKNVPYSSIIQAYQGLVRQILTENREKIQYWRETILEAIGQNGRVITDVIPDMELIIGEQNPLPELGPDESQNRFNHVFRKLTGVFATRDHPLVLFLDDLQWADSASFQLMKTLLTDQEIHHFYLIGAYRDNEVDESHPLTLTCNEIVREGVTVNSIILPPLGGDSVNEFISDFLHLPKKRTAALSSLIFRKTGGNPFFINQFMKNLYDERLIAYDHQLGWQWNMDVIEQMQVTENVVELLEKKITRLPERSVDLLKVCACVGNRFDLEMLASVFGLSVDDALADLTPAIHEGLISLHNDIYRFHHDRIQEAAYSLISVEEKQSLHYQIGHIILNQTDENQLFDKIFYIVHHLNTSSGLIADEEDKIKLSKLNLVAGRKAKDSAAYESAGKYFQKGIDLLDGGSWTEQYSLTFSHYMELAECMYLTGDFDNSDRMFRVLLDNSSSLVDTLRVYTTRNTLYTNMAMYGDVIELGIKALRMAGINIPASPTMLHILKYIAKINWKLRSKSMDHLLNMPEISDPLLVEITRLLESMSQSAFYINRNLNILLALVAMDIVIKHGNTDMSPFLYMTLGSIFIAGLGQYQKGQQFADMALQMNDRYMGKSYSQTLFLYGLLVQHWKRHAREDIPYFRKGYSHALEIGNILYACHCANNMGDYAFVVDDNLEEPFSEYMGFGDFIKATNDPFITASFEDNVRCYYNLVGKTDDRLSFNMNDNYDEERLEAVERLNNSFDRFLFFLTKIRVYCIFNKFEEASEMAEHIAPLKDEMAGTMHVPEFMFYYSLAMSGAYNTAGTLKKMSYRLKLNSSLRKMKRWAELAPENFLHKSQLMQAEMFRLRGKNKKAEAMYDETIKSCLENHYVNNHALACERAATFHSTLGNTEKMATLLKNAHYSYSKWGALSKASELQETYPDYLAIDHDDSSQQEQGKSTYDTDTTSSSTVSNTKVFDLATALKASQVISGEIVLGKLLEKIMNFVMENAGADKAILMLRSNESLAIEARAQLDSNEISVLQSIPLAESDDIPASIVNYVERTMKEVILNDVSADSTFSSDPYIQEHQPGSVLCMPILNHGDLTGMLYLENRLASNVFMPDRLQLLSVIASQAAVSIDNARLYANLESKVEERTKALNETNQYLTEANKNLKTAQDIANRDMKMAANVQTSFLPSEPPESANWELAYIFKPMSGVSGDFYDFYMDGDELAGVSLFDVSGHGIASGLITMLSKSIIFRHFNERKHESLNSVIESINSDLIAELDNIGNYLTGIMLRFDDGNVEYVNAGHTDLLYKPASGDRVLICGQDSEFEKGLFLGLSPMEQKFNVMKFPVYSEDLLLLYSDCLVEAMNDNREQYTQERLMEVFDTATNRKSSPQEILDTIMQDFYSFTGIAELNDDLTVLLLRKK